MQKCGHAGQRTLCLGLRKVCAGCLFTSQPTSGRPAHNCTTRAIDSSATPSKPERGVAFCGRVRSAVCVPTRCVRAHHLHTNNKQLPGTLRLPPHHHFCRSIGRYTKAHQTRPPPQSHTSQLLVLSFLTSFSPHFFDSGLLLRFRRSS